MALALLCRLGAETCQRKSTMRRPGFATPIHVALARAAVDKSTEGHAADGRAAVTFTTTDVDPVSDGRAAAGHAAENSTTLEPATLEPTTLEPATLDPVSLVIRNRLRNSRAGSRPIPSSLRL